jgi:hypothetical protein
VSPSHAKTVRDVGETKHVRYGHVLHMDYKKNSFRVSKVEVSNK